MKKLNKKMVNTAILCAICVVLLWGLIASFSAYANVNNFPITISPRNSSGSDRSLAKDGKFKLSGTVDSADVWICVHSREVEDISSLEWQKRIVKNRDLVSKNAKRLYDANKSGENAATLKLEYELAVADYNTEKKALSIMKSDARLTASDSFFGIYIPVLIFLGIAFVINQKAEYGDKEAKVGKIEETKKAEAAATEETNK